MHLELFPEIPATWRDEALAEKWRKVRTVRRVVTGALEVERADKRIGSSLEAAPVVYVSDADLFAALVEIDLAEVCITSAATLVEGEGPAEAFRLADVQGVAVGAAARRRAASARARGKSRRAVGSDPDYPDVTPRDAQALREWDAMRERRRSDVLAAIPLRPAHPPRPDRGRDRLRARSGGEALAAVRLRSRQPRASSSLTPFLDLVLTWNTGHQLRPVSAGERFRPLRAARAQDSAPSWCCGSGSRGRNRASPRSSLGLIIGGAFGNAIDRLAYGAVMDFVLFHITTPTLQVHLVRV